MQKYFNLEWKEIEMFEIKIKLTTESCCLIGNQTESFSVGGVDQSTTIDENGRPIIHGSAFKGALRNIVREQEKKEGQMEKTKEYVKCIINEILEKYRSEDIVKTEKIKKMILNLENKVNSKDLKAEYIFGMEGINGLPRIFCSDFRVIESKDKKIGDYFLIDTKNCIEEINGNILSNPRTYKVIKPGVEFEGIIRFYNPFLIEDENEIKKIETPIEKDLKDALRMFNKGIYGIGNSKSRGYGQIRVAFDNDQKEGKCDDKV
jgi:hypothetical protein